MLLPSRYVWHSTLRGLQATHKPTLAGLLLPSCLIVVSLLGCVWNSGTAPTGSLPGKSTRFLKTPYITSSNYSVLKLLCVCVYVFFRFILDMKFFGRTSRGHTGGRSHRIFHPPSFCGACLNFSREKVTGSASPFPRRPWSRILQEFCVLTI